MLSVVLYYKSTHKSAFLIGRRLLWVASEAAHCIYVSRKIILDNWSCVYIRVCYTCMIDLNVLCAAGEA